MTSSKGLFDIIGNFVESSKDVKVAQENNAAIAESERDTYIREFSVTILMCSIQHVSRD